MSKSTVILNGENTSEVKDYTSDANVNMGAAINDTSCAKHLETFNSKDNKGGILPYPCDFDHLYASNMSENENFTDKSSEIIHLKELLLLHLDLIQQQSEQLVTKDKQISALKLENDTLKQRLARMDRRVTLKKHKELSEVLTASNHSALPDVELDQIAPTTDFNATQQSDVMMTPVTSNQDSNHIVRRRRREDKLSGSVWSASGPKRRNRSLSWTSSVTSNTDVTPSTKVNGGKLVKRERHQRRERTRKKRSKKEDASDKKDDSILITDSPYYTPVGDANTIWNTEEIPVSGCVLEVPSWRVKVFTSCYTMEGTENLSDDVFDRRHSKLEIDERRRKRWDVQRIREQRQLEKLRLGRKRNGGGDGDELVSLWPSPDQAQFLQIQDSLPVAAFGCPITKFNPADSEFTLPWVNGRDFGRSRPSYGSRKKR